MYAGGMDRPFSSRRPSRLLGCSPRSRAPYAHSRASVPVFRLVGRLGWLERCLVFSIRRRRVGDPCFGVKRRGGRGGRPVRPILRRGRGPRIDGMTQERLIHATLLAWPRGYLVGVTTHTWLGSWLGRSDVRKLPPRPSDLVQVDQDHDQCQCHKNSKDYCIVLVLSRHASRYIPIPG